LLKPSTLASIGIVYDKRFTAPAAERRTGRAVLSESQRAQALCERGVLCVRSHVHDGVDILGRTDATGSRVRDEEAGRTAADEDEVVEYGVKQADDGLEERAIRVRHAVTP
jgi:hypothetical protein